MMREKYYLNGSEIEDGFDFKMPDLVANLKTQKGMRDQLISSGAKSKEEAELKVEIESSGIAEHQAAISVLNACSSAGVIRFPLPSIEPKPLFVFSCLRL